MKTRRIMAGLCLACCSAASAAARGAPAAKADFSGTWVLDGQETDFAMNQFAILFEGRVPMGGLSSNSLTQNL